MPQLARLDFYVQDTAGNAVSGASVEVRKQGAQIQTGGPTSFTVDDPGAILVGDLTRINATATPTMAVSSVAATNVTVAAGGFAGTLDDDRIAVASPLPAIYADALGNDTKINPLSTDANGYAFCWVLGGKYDALVSGPGITTRLLTDVAAVGGESNTSNIYPSASSVAFQKDTLRAQVSGGKLERWLSGAVERFYIDLNASLNPRLPAHNVAGALTIDSGGLTITAGGETITAGDLTFGAAASRIVPGATSLSLRNNANSADNLLISDAGRATLRENLVLSAAASKIVAGVTSLALRNNADNADNLLITDAGVVTSRADLTATTGNVKATAGDIIGRRALFTRGTTLTVADFSISAGWGTTATKAINGAAYDTVGEFQVTSNGTGQAINATVTLTFKDGAFPGATPPNVIITRSESSAPSTGFWVVGSRTVSFFVARFTDLPVAGSLYAFQYFVAGGFPS